MVFVVGDDGNLAISFDGCSEGDDQNPVGKDFEKGHGSAHPRMDWVDKDGKNNFGDAEGWHSGPLLS